MLKFKLILMILLLGVGFLGICFLPTPYTHFVGVVILGIYWTIVSIYEHQTKKNK